MGARVDGFWMRVAESLGKGVATLVFFIPYFLLGWWFGAFEAFEWHLTWKQVVGLAVLSAMVGS